jgi:hypothetical protein
VLDFFNAVDSKSSAPSAVLLEAVAHFQSRLASQRCFFRLPATTVA